jgi:hypothetical protein
MVIKMFFICHSYGEKNILVAIGITTIEMGPILVAHSLTQVA